MKEWILAALTVVVAGAGVLASRFLSGSQRVPAGQPPLLTLKRDNLERVRDLFNANASRTRVIVFLSPS